MGTKGVLSDMYQFEWNPDKAKQMGEEGRRLVETEYCWPKIVERVVGLYREAIEKKGKA